MDQLVVEVERSIPGGEIAFGYFFVIMLAVLSMGVSYICGCMNGAVIVSKYILRDDVRNHGSGNAGLTNFYRTFGGPLTLVVILFDAVKMILAVLISLALPSLMIGYAVGMAGFWEMPVHVTLLLKYWAGLWCVVGHMYPCMFHFKGGKGVLSGGTLVWMIDWRIGLVAWGGFLLLAVLTKWVSLGSVWAGFSYPISTWFAFHDPLLVILAIIPGWLLVWKHRGNIQRILKGTESKFSFHHKKDAG